MDSAAVSLTRLHIENGSTETQQRKSTDIMTKVSLFSINFQKKILEHDDDYQERKLVAIPSSFSSCFFLYILTGPLILSFFLCKLLTVNRMCIHKPKSLHQSVILML